MNNSVRPAAAREMPAVRMTIVGGRPPGCGRPLGEIPRGVEVLVKKASVDPWFKALLLSRRAGAAEAIGLALAPAEAALLNFIPAAQLEAVIASTKVEPGKVPAFLGRAAAVMLVALGASAASSQVACNKNPTPAGHATTRPAEAASQPATQPTTQATDETAMLLEWSRHIQAGLTAKTGPDTIAKESERLRDMELQPGNDPATKPATQPNRPDQIQLIAGLRAPPPASQPATEPTATPAEPTTKPTTQPTTLPTSLPAQTVAKMVELVAQLDDEHFKKREDAQKQLVEMGPDIAPSLLEMKQSGKQSLEASSRLDAAVRAIVDKLIGQMNYPDPAHFDEPAQKLKAMGTAVIPYLSDAIKGGKLDAASMNRVRWVIIALHAQPPYPDVQIRAVLGARPR